MTSRCCQVALCPVAVALVAILVAGMRAVPLGEVVRTDLSGKTFVVTGPTSGLGKRHVEILMKWNASLVLAVRDLQKGHELAEALVSLNPLAAKPQVYELRLNSLASVRQFASVYQGPVDVLVHNAGAIGYEPCPKTSDGFGEVLQVNYLSTFLLTNLLLSRLESSPAGRIVHVSGEIYQDFGQLNLSAVEHDGITDLNAIPRQSLVMGNLMGTYADSKLAQVLFSAALSRRLKPPAVTHALHPAVSSTGLGREHREMSSSAGKILNDFFRGVVYRILTHVGIFQNAEDAPKTQIHVSTHPEIQKVNGLYYSAFAPPLADCGRPANLCGTKSPGQIAENVTLQEELWTVSCRILGVADSSMCSRSPREH